jgi:DivIVA domain-containing protein
MIVATSELETSPLHPAEIAAHRFPVARKGYAQGEVQHFLRLVAEHLSRLQGEIEWQRARGEHLERRTTAAQEAAYVRLSRDFMDVVRRADEAAGRVRADAEAQARAEVGSANREAARLLAAAVEQAEMILTEARSEAERMLREAKPRRSNREDRPPPGPDTSTSHNSDTSIPAAGPDTQAMTGLWSLADEAKEPAARPRPRPDEGDLDVELDVSLLDLFGDIG